MTSPLYQKKNQIAEDLRMLENGFLPESCFYKIDTSLYIDNSKIQYNKRYKEPQYFMNKLPRGMRNMHGMDTYCQKLADEAMTPLQAMLLRQQPDPDSVISLYMPIY